MNEKIISQNKQLLRNIDRDLADILENTSSKKWEMTPDGTNLIDLESKNYLHSQEDPLGEANRWASTIKLSAVNTIFVYGLGLGYYYEPLKEWLKENDNYLIFIEDDPEIISHFLSRARAAEMLKSPKVRIALLPKKLENTKKFEELMLQFYKKPYQVTGLMSYIRNKKDNLLRLSASIDYMINIYKWIHQEYDSLGLPFYRNFYANLLKIPKSKTGSSFFQRFKGKPAIICGAGPSLKKNIGLLGGLKNKALIIAGGTAINALNAAGINPHIGFGIDPNEDHALRVLTNEAFMVPYFYHLRMYTSALNLLHGDLYYQNTINNYPISYWIEKKLSIPSIPIESGHNVCNISFDLAYALGCSPIITVGIDLAYSEGDSYAPILSFHPLAEGTLKFVTKLESEELIPRVDIEGKPVLTLWKWMLEAVWYSKFCIKHPDALVINATEGGIGFPGVPNMKLKEVEETYLNAEYDFEGMIHALSLDAAMPLCVNLSALKECLTIIQKSLEKVLILTKEMSEESTRISSEKEFLSYTHDTEKEQSELEREEAYGAFLEFFDKRYTTVVQKEIKTLESEWLEPDELASKKARLQAARYDLLQRAADLNLDYIKKTLNHIAILQGEETVPLKKSAPPNDLDKGYLFDEKKYAIKDPLLGIDFSETLSGIKKIVEKTPENPIEWRAYLKNDHLHGPSVFLKEGRILSKTWYRFGQKHGKSCTYFADGSLASCLGFNEGRPDKEHLYYYEDGSLRAKIGYHLGKLNGRLELYHKNGKLKRLIDYKMGLKNGEEALYTESAERIIESHYLEGRPINNATYFSPKGEILKQIVYKEDGQVDHIMVRSSDGFLVKLDPKGQEDYFDKVTAQTENLTESLGVVFKNLKDFLSEIRNDQKFLKAHEELLNSLNEGVMQIGSELQHLSSLGQELIMESKGKEGIWKTPSAKKILDSQLTVLQESVKEGIASIRSSIDLVISAYVDFHKNHPDKDK